MSDSQLTKDFVLHFSRLFNDVIPHTVGYIKSPQCPGAYLGGGVTRVTSHPPLLGSLFHFIIMRVN